MTFHFVRLLLPRLKKNRKKAEDVSSLRFQNEYNKVEIALCVVQFWSEIKRVITSGSTHRRPKVAS